MSSFQRPAFWRVPKNKPLPERVSFGSPAGSCLQRGDIISKIGNYDARDVRHQDAQTLFKNAGTNIKVVVQRDTSNKHNTSTASSRCSSQTPMSISPNLSPRGPMQAPAAYHQDAFPVITESYIREYYPGGQRTKRPEDEELEHVINQPYRTTPLVLPGAKVKREHGPTESYLRHHPNPAVRSPPHHLDTDYLMKQRIVHKQFNSPIGMYSDANIADTIKHQAGLAAPKKFDPSLSETYKALQEEQIGDHVQEVTVPVQPKLFTPNKTIPAKKPVAINQPPQPYVNSMGNSGETIQQSGSFKRLMYHVMAESSF